MAELKIPQTEQPTILNKDAVIGAGVGEIIGIPVGMAVGLAAGYIASPEALTEVLTKAAEGADTAPLQAVASTMSIASTATYLGTTAIGAVIGGRIGKARTESELINGKEVRSPTLFNKDVLVYGLGIPLAIGLTTLAASAVVSIPATAQLVIGAAEFGSMVLGAAYGAFAGKAEMQKDYDQAIEQLQSKAQVQSVAIAKAKEHLASVEPERTTEKSYVKTLEQERAGASLNMRA